MSEEKQMVLEVLKQQLAYEKQRKTNKIWTREYLEGYIAGLKQSYDVVKEIL